LLYTVQVWHNFIYIHMNILNKQSQTADKGGSPPAWRLGSGLTPLHKKTLCYEMLHMTSDLGMVAGSCEHGNEPSGSIHVGNSLASWAYY
jgi:hypothetical protein